MRVVVDTTEQAGRREDLGRRQASPRRCRQQPVPTRGRRQRVGLAPVRQRQPGPVRRDRDPRVQQPAGQRDIRRVGRRRDRPAEGAGLLPLLDRHPRDAGADRFAVAGEQRLDRPADIDLRADVDRQVRLRHGWKRRAGLRQELADGERVAAHVVVRQARDLQDHRGGGGHLGRRRGGAALGDDLDRLRVPAGRVRQAQDVVTGSRHVDPVAEPAGVVARAVVPGRRERVLRA